MLAYIYPNEAEFQWSIMIVLYPFITGLVAGAFVVSSLYHVFGMKALRSVARMALVAALAFLLIAPVPLQAHLGRPERAFEIFLTPHFTSAMAGFGYIWMAYLVLVVVETWLVFRADIVARAQSSPWPLSMVYRSMALGVYDVSDEAMEVDHKLIKILAAIGIPAAALLHGYVGFIFGAIKANPWWSTPLMPVIFLLSAIVSGIALLIVMYVVCMKLLGRKVDHECVRAMAGLLAAFLFIDLTLEGLELLSMAYEQEESWDIVRGLIGRMAFSFLLVQILLGAVVPLLTLGYISLFKVRDRVSTAITTACGVLVVVGVFAMRWNVVVGGQTISKSLRGYVQYEWIFGGREGILMAALILCVPFVLFTLLATLLPPWVPEEPEAIPAPVGAPHALRNQILRWDYGDKRPRKSYRALKLAFAGLATLMAVLFFGVMRAPGKPGLLDLFGSQPAPVLVPQVREAFDAKLVSTITKPDGGAWTEPLDVTVLDGRVFVLDHAGARLVEIDESGKFIHTFDASGVPGLTLRHPHALANDGTNIYIGNTFPPVVYVLDPRAGRLTRTISLPPGDVEGLPTVPTGLAFNRQGNLVVSDGQNHRLLVLTPDGALAEVVDRPPGSWDLVVPQGSQGAPARQSGVPVSNVANTGRPGSIGVANDGTMLAVDILGPGVARVQVDGSISGHFARPGDSTGGVLDPTDIAVDGAGRIFIADELIEGVMVYDAAGKPLGVIGRADPNSFTAKGELNRPSALALDGDRLYVVDRGRGLLVYQLPPAAPQQVSAN